MNEWICRKKAGKGFAFSRCGWLADYDSHKLTKRPKASLGSCPLPTRLPRNQRSTAAPPRPPERVRKYCLAGKPEALVIPPPPAHACPPRLALPTPGHPVRTWGRAPDTAGSSPAGRLTLPRMRSGLARPLRGGATGQGFWVFFLCSRPCSSHLPRTGARLSLGFLGVCDWPGPRSSAQRGLAEGGLASGVRSLPVTVRSPRRPRSGRVGGDSGLGKRVRPLPEEAGGPGTAGGLLEPPSARRVGPGTVGRGWE